MDPESGERPIEINFRLIRESHTAVRDARIYVEARFTVPTVLMDGQGSSSFNRHRTRKCSQAGNGLMLGTEKVRAELELFPHQMSSLDHWHVTHHITESSPLWPIRHELRANLRSVDVSLSAYDTAFQQKVKLYVNYKKDDFVHNAHFEPLHTLSEDGATTSVDLSKLDSVASDMVRKGLSRMPSLSKIPIFNNMLELGKKISEAGDSARSARRMSKSSASSARNSKAGGHKSTCLIDDPFVVAQKSSQDGDESDLPKSDRSKKQSKGAPQRLQRVETRSNVDDVITV